jgi:hypothetical protein
MTERAWIYELCQFGVEGTATPGSPATANRRMSAMMVSPGIKADISQYRASGFKYPTVAALNKEWVEADVSGAITYTEIVYPLSSVLERVTPSGSPAYTWAFTPDSDGPDDINTFTVQTGSSVRAAQFAYGMFTALTLTFSRDGNELSGTMLGQAISDGATIVGTPTTVALVPVLPTEVTVKLATTQAGLGAASALARVVDVEWSISDRFAPVWVLDGDTSFPAHVEVEPTLSARLVVHADAEGMGPLANMRSGDSTFMRITGTGTSIGTVAPYSITIDTALKVTEEPSEWRDEDGVTAIEWNFGGVHDGTWGSATSVTVVTTVASL